MLDWLYPQTVEIVHSKINGEIEVVKSRGRYSVWVGGFEQSGSVYVEKLWKKGLREAEKYFLHPPKSVLILGFGCGTAAKLISQKWPYAHIVGVEIDPVMIQLGKKYFGLDTVSNLKIIKADACKQVRLLAKKKQKFDLILVDTYLGGKSSGDPDCRFLLKNNGIIISNHLEGLKTEFLFTKGGRNHNRPP